MTARSRILIADEHTLIAELCANLLKSEFDVIGIVRDGCSMVREVGKLKPDLVLVIAMPILNGLDAGEQVKRRRRTVKLVYLTMKSSTIRSAAYTPAMRSLAVARRREYLEAN